MNIIDTHCHLNDDRLYQDIDAVIVRCKEKGVTSCFVTADSYASFSRIIELQERYPSFCRSVLGLHPEFINDEEYYQKAFSYIKERRDRIYAIGEIGLDYHYSKDEDIKTKQKDLFTKQIKLAKELDLPIVIHSRDADFDTLNIIKEYLPKKIDLHCFSGSAEILKEYLKLPIEVHIGINGVCTFKNAKTIKEIIKAFPLDIMLTETDCPYLAPTPFRGQTNSPEYLPYIIEEIAKIKEKDIEEVANILYNNARGFYGI